MSKKLAREGWFRAWITSSGVGINKENGNIQFVADLEVAEEYDFDSTTYVDITSTEEREIAAFCTLYSSKYSDKILFFGDQLKGALDWNGDIKVLNTADYSKVPVLIHAEYKEFEGKNRLKVTRIGHAEDTPGGGSATKATDADLDVAMAKFMGAQRQFMGGDKPKAIPGKPISKPPIPLGTVTTVTSLTANKEQMATAGEQAKAETDAASAEAEYNALSPKEKKAFNKAKKEAAITAKAAVNVPGRPEATKPPSPAPSVEETGVRVSAQQELVEALDLSASCTKDEAWASCEANAHPDRLESLAETWTKEVNKFGNDAAVETAKAWPEVRTGVLEQVIDDLPS